MLEKYAHLHIKHSFNSRIVHRRLDFSLILKSEKKKTLYEEPQSLPAVPAT